MKIREKIPGTLIGVAIGLLILIAGANYCANKAVAVPAEPTGLRVTMLQDEDSLRLAFRWLAPVPIETDTTIGVDINHYETRVILLDGDTLAQGATKALADTLGLAYPPLGCIGPAVVGVAAVDLRANQSDYLLSDEFPICPRKRVVGPNPPRGLMVDTVGVPGFMRPGRVNDLRVLPDTGGV